MNILFSIYNITRKLFRRLPIDHCINWLIFRFNRVPWPKHCKVRGFIFLRNNGKVVIGENVIINSRIDANPIGGDGKTLIVIKANAELRIGNNVGISNSAFFVSRKIVMEDDVQIGGGCRIYDSDFHSVHYEDRIERGNINMKTAPVIIRKGCWLGAGVIVLKGVEIGEKSVIAAGAVVSKSVPPGEIWGGNPARFIKKL